MSNTNTTRRDELIKIVNSSRAALQELINNYPGEVHYDSAKFKRGEDHLCERATKILDYNLVTKMKVFNPFTVQGVQVSMNGTTVRIGSLTFNLAGLKTSIRSLIEGGIVGTLDGVSFVPTRTGVRMGSVTLSWESVEQLHTALQSV